MGVDPVVSAVRNENQELPAGAIRSPAQERVVQIEGRIERPEDFADIVVARRGGNSIRLSQVADVIDGQQEQESLALYNGRRTLAIDIQKAQDQNTLAVTEGLRQALEELQPTLDALYPGVEVDTIKDGLRQIQVGVGTMCAAP